MASITEWMPSEIIEALPVIAAATNFESAISKSTASETYINKRDFII